MYKKDNLNNFCARPTLALAKTKDCKRNESFFVKNDEKIHFLVILFGHVKKK